MLIPLTQVSDTHTVKLEKLKPLWIHNVQQVYSLSKSPNWKEYLEEKLGSDLSTIIGFAEEKLSEAEKSRLSETPTKGEFPLGLKLVKKNGKMMLGKPSSSDLKRISPEKNMPNGINWLWKMPQIHIRNQGNRGTCVAFAVTAVNEFLHYDRSVHNYLSPQFVYYECKKKEGDDSEEGTTIELGMDVLENVGEPREAICPYNPFIEEGTVKQDQPTRHSYEEAKFYKITEKIPVDSNSVNGIKKELIRKRLVAIGIPVYHSWYSESPYTRLTGEISMPRDDEKPDGGHAICIVGYQDIKNGDSTPPGGGFFIIRNSWGEEWGRENLYASGYGLIPYAYVEKYGQQAYTARL